VCDWWTDIGVQELTAFLYRTDRYFFPTKDGSTIFLQKVSVYLPNLTA
jgi:hypothetical protein